MYKYQRPRALKINDNNNRVINCYENSFIFSIKLF